jgi:hypothetical protein
MNAAGIQQKQQCKQQRLCNNRINAATGSIQQQDPCNSRIHAIAGAMNVAAMLQKQTAAVVQQQELCKKAAGNY